MADVDYEVAAHFTGDGELRQGAAAFERMGDAAKRSLSDIEQRAKGGGLGLLNLQAAIGVAGQAFSTFQNLAKGALDALTEGAALADAKGDFIDLTAAIGSTADVMLGKLKTATGGLVTDSQLVSDASNLMALNLGLSADEIVAFSGAAAELDWNMEALADTLNTGSTRGLKEMNLSIDDVKAKMAALEEQGIATDKAFRMAILDAAGEKIDRVGKKSEEAAGQIQKLGVMWATSTEKFKENFAEAVVVQLGQITGAIQDAAPGFEQGMAQLGTSAGNVLGDVLAEGAALGLDKINRDMMEQIGLSAPEQNALIQKIKKEIDQPVFGGGEADLRFASALNAALTETYGMTLKLSDSNAWAVWASGAATAAASTEQVATALEGVDFQAARREGREYIAMLEDMGRAVKAGGADMSGLGDLAADGMAQAAQAAEDAAAAWDDFFQRSSSENFAGFLDQIGDATEQGTSWGFDAKQAIFDAMRTGGAGAAPMADFAEQLGIDAGAIQEALSAVQQQGIIDNLVQAAQDGKLAWSDFAATVQDAFRILEGGFAVDLGARVMPEVDMRGFRENFQEQLTTEGLGQTVTIEVDANTELAVAAVNEVTGLVDTYAAMTPEAVATLNIDDVRTNAGQAAELINSIPTQKTITVNWQESGASVVTALRALGVIP